MSKAVIFKINVLNFIFSIIAFIIIFKLLNLFHYLANYIEDLIGLRGFTWLLLPIIAFIFYKIFVMICWRIVSIIMVGT